MCPDIPSSLRSANSLSRTATNTHRMRRQRPSSERTDSLFSVFAPTTRVSTAAPDLENTWLTSRVTSKPPSNTNKNSKKTTAKPVRSAKTPTTKRKPMRETKTTMMNVVVNSLMLTARLVTMSAKRLRIWRKTDTLMPPCTLSANKSMILRMTAHRLSMLDLCAPAPDLRSISVSSRMKNATSSFQERMWRSTLLMMMVTK
mmetsp:Transcript_40761/g.57319  ORF Transcript_40761/g.57319 Transcript_40761/m.57319 type:complete len:201 (+) Transcript_40761:232-834(+)